MPTPIAPHIILAQNARTELQAIARAHSTPQSLALRARIVLRAAECDRPTNLHNRPRVGLFQPHGGQMATALSGPGLPGLQDACAQGVRARLPRPRVSRSSPWPAPCLKNRIAPSPVGP